MYLTKQFQLSQLFILAPTTTPSDENDDDGCVHNHKIFTISPLDSAHQIWNNGSLTHNMAYSACFEQLFYIRFRTQNFCFSLSRVEIKLSNATARQSHIDTRIHIDLSVGCAK